MSALNPSSHNKGFTVVELLIVIIIVAILATITIVAYSGITAKANTTKAQTNAASLKKVLEAFNAEFGYYPYTISQITGYNASTKLPSGITVLRGPGGATTATAFAATGTAPAGLANVLNSAGTITPLTNSTVTTSAGSGMSNLAYSALTASTANTGGAILYMDFTTGVVSTTYTYVGSANASSTYVQPAA